MQQPANSGTAVAWAWARRVPGGKIAGAEFVNTCSQICYDF